MTGLDEANVTLVALHPAAANTGHALPTGWRLHEFEIESRLGDGGFGIVYLARDLQLKRQVAIKEFMPSALASRHPGMSVAVKADRFRAAFTAGRRSFINEAQLLAQFDHPALVKVYRFWEENGTAYMVMPYYRGKTLSQWLKSQSEGPSEEALLPLIEPLLEALERLHSQSVFHRDIAPDNVLLLETGRPLLLDFGSARRIIGDMTQVLTVFVKPGYAPIEQYAEVRSMRQGPWTDIYALSALLYVAVTRRAPPPAVARMMKDDYVPAAALAAGRYTNRFLTAIDRGLMLRPRQRPSTIGEFRELLGLAGAKRLPAPNEGEANVVPLHVPPSTLPALDEGEVNVLPLRAPPSMPFATAPSTAAPITEPEAIGRSPPHAAASARSPTLAIAAAVTAALVIVGASLTWWKVRYRVEPSEVQKSVALTGPPQATAPAATPVDSRLASPQLSQPIAMEAKPARIPDPADLVRELYEARTPSIAVQARTTKSSLLIGRDAMRPSVVSSRGGYLVVLLAGTEAELAVLVPNNGQRDARVEAGRELRLPTFDATGPPGIDRLIFIVSERPLALDAGPAEGGSLPRFDLRKIAAKRSTAGESRCSGVIACDAVYGAAMLEVREVDR